MHIYLWFQPKGIKTPLKIKKGPELTNIFSTYVETPEILRTKLFYCS